MAVGCMTEVVGVRSQEEAAWGERAGRRATAAGSAGMAAAVMAEGVLEVAAVNVAVVEAALVFAAARSRQCVVASGLGA